MWWTQSPSFTLFPHFPPFLACSKSWIYSQTHLLTKRGRAFHHHANVLQQIDVQVIVSTEGILAHHVYQPTEKAAEYVPLQCTQFHLIAIQKNYKDITKLLADWVFVRHIRNWLLGYSTSSKWLVGATYAPLHIIGYICSIRERSVQCNSEIFHRSMQCKKCETFRTVACILHAPKYISANVPRSTTPQQWVKEHNGECLSVSNSVALSGVQEELSLVSRQHHNHIKSAKHTRKKKARQKPQKMVPRRKKRKTVNC